MIIRIVRVCLNIMCREIYRYLTREFIYFDIYRMYIRVLACASKDIGWRFYIPEPGLIFLIYIDNFSPLYYKLHVI